MPWPADGRHPQLRGALKDAVLRVYGIDATQDSELDSIAADLLDQTIKDMNSHLYEFNKVNQTISPLIADTADYELDPMTAGPGGGVTPSTPAVPYKESQAYLLKTDSSRVYLNYLPWVRFSEQLSGRFGSTSGIPSTYSFRNLEADGLLSLFPAPNAGTVGDYTLVLEYYRRIPLLSEVPDDDSTIAVPEEVETPLIYGACKRLAIHLVGASHPDVAAFAALEKISLEELKAVDKRHPDQLQRFRLIDRINRGQLDRNSLFIKV